MITEKDVQEAIAECLGERHPNANTCLKLASYYIIHDHIRNNGVVVSKAETTTPWYSYTSAPIDTAPDLVTYQSDTEFSMLINGREATEVWPVMDELMTALQVVNPKLYANVIRRLRN